VLTYSNSDSNSKSYQAGMLTCHARWGLCCRDPWTEPLQALVRSMRLQIAEHSLRPGCFLQCSITREGVKAASGCVILSAVVSKPYPLQVCLSLSRKEAEIFSLQTIPLADAGFNPVEFVSSYWFQRGREQTDEQIPDSSNFVLPVFFTTTSLFKDMYIRARLEPRDAPRINIDVLSYVVSLCRSIFQTTTSLTMICGV
jgi:hypothetical protein